MRLIKGLLASLLTLVILLALPAVLNIGLAGGWEFGLFLLLSIWVGVLVYRRGTQGRAT